MYVCFHNYPPFGTTTIRKNHEQKRFYILTQLEITIIFAQSKLKYIIAVIAVVVKQGDPFITAFAKSPPYILPFSK